MAADRARSCAAGRSRSPRRCYRRATFRGGTLTAGETPSHRKSIAVSNLATCIEAGLDRLASYLQQEPWYGRENELVNLFAHRCLIPDLVPPGKIGIEVAVKQLPRPGRKALVRKDLVIWPEADQTVWVKDNPTNDPAVIVEFKVNDERKCARDIDWLCDYTTMFPTVLGYSVCGFVSRAQPRAVKFLRISRGRRPDAWSLAAGKFGQS